MIRLHFHIYLMLMLQFYLSNLHNKMPMVSFIIHKHHYSFLSSSSADYPSGKRHEMLMAIQRGDSAILRVEHRVRHESLEVAAMPHLLLGSLIGLAPG